MLDYANEVLTADGLDYRDLDPEAEDGKLYLDAVREAAVASLGYFLRPDELVSAVARRAGSRRIGGVLAEAETRALRTADVQAGVQGEMVSGDSDFILEDLQAILNNIERSTLGTDSEEDFDKLFEDLDLGSTKLGRTVRDRNALVG